MAAKSTSDKGSDRRMRGFERADSLLAARVRKAGEGRGFAVTRLLTHWAEVAGEDLAQSTRPVRINYGRGGFGATLTLLVRGAEAPLIQAQLPRLKDRVNACYGYAAVARITLTQTAPTGFAEGQADFQHRKAPQSAPAPDSAAQVRGRAATDGVADENLRLALSSLGAHILINEND